MRVLAAVSFVVLATAAGASAASVTYTNPNPITVPDGAQAALYPSNILVSGTVGPIHRVKVTLEDLSHANPDDLDVFLVAPFRDAVLMSDACGASALSGVDLTFDSRAALAISDSGPCPNGTYLDADYAGTGTDTYPAPAPTPSGNTLSDLNFSSADGTWSLYVVDDETNAASGVVAGGWSLDIETSIYIREGFSPAEADPYPATLARSGPATTISDLNITLDRLIHDDADDIDMLLVGPTGAETTLMSDACGGGGANVLNEVSFTLDDEAGATLPDNGPCSAGSYKPTNHTDSPADSYPAPAPAAGGAASLTAFDGTNPNGTWSLYIVDDRFTEGNSGELLGWSLNIQTPTAVEGVERFVAHRAPRGADVTWRTASEKELLGFDVYRDGRKLNRSLIRAKAMGTIAGAAYRLVDPSVSHRGSHTYRLELVELNGTRVQYGTSTLTVR